MRAARRIRLGIVAALVAVTVLLPAKSMAVWRFGNQIYLQEGMVCRDGMQMSIAYFADQAQSEADSPITVPVSARLYAETSLPLQDSETQDFPFEYYGPLLTSARLTMTYHPTPISDPQGFDGKFYTYSLNNRIPWTRRLAVGSRVVLQGGAATWPATVQNCDLNPAAVDEGAALTIGSTFLKAADGTIAPAALTYRVDAAPSNGSLRLDGAPLAVGGFFTQADVNAGRLSYLHNGSETTSDGFAFSVSATIRVSVATNGAQATGGNSLGPSLTGDAGSVAFSSSATNLVEDDTNGVADVFVRDRVASFCRPANTTTRVSIDSAGTEGDAASTTTSVNEDATRIAFESVATNLVAGDTNGQKDIFIHKRFFGADCTPAPETVRASVSSTSTQADRASSVPSISADGFDIAFQSLATNLVGGDTLGIQDIFANSNSNFTWRLTGPSTLSEEANGASESPSISANGDAIAFRSDADNLVAGDNNTSGDIFVWQSFGISRVSLSSAGDEANDRSGMPRISASGNTVAFRSWATNLVAGDSNGGPNGVDIFVRDRQSNTTERVSVSSGGGQSNADAAKPALSAGGRNVAFYSSASNLVAGDTNSCGTPALPVNCSDIFVHDRVAGTTRRISVDSTGAQANGHSYNPSMSYDGSYVAFDSHATNLVSGDSNRVQDVFLHYLGFSSSLPISIRPANDAPVARADDYSVAEDATLDVAAPGVLANDADAEGATLTAALVSGPAHGAVTLHPNGSFSYRPAAGFSGTDSFTYRASDGALDSQVAIVSIRVSALDDSRFTYLPMVVR